MLASLRSLHIAAASLLFIAKFIAAEESTLRVESDFEGASIANVKIEASTQTIHFAPGGDPMRGWPCWWYFRVAGAKPGETITLRLSGSKATASDPQAPLQKPLAPSWAMPNRAAFSYDGETWLHTADGKREGNDMVYTFKTESETVSFAWGPPYTPSRAEKFLRETASAHSFAKYEELCRSRNDRAVPMLHIAAGERPAEKRFGVWVQARQHAWESGGSWVADGFRRWVVSDDPAAVKLRERTEIFLVPIIDIDNTAGGHGGKDAHPQDHNRDWKEEPHWNEVRAAQRKCLELVEQKRLDLFLDLHNPGPGDPTFFFKLADDRLPPEAVPLRQEFIDRTYKRISSLKPLFPMSSTTKETGPNYHPLWRQISTHWVTTHGNKQTVALCLETGWNHPRGNQEGYLAVGETLAQATAEYFDGREERK